MVRLSLLANFLLTCALCMVWGKKQPAPTVPVTFELAKNDEPKHRPAALSTHAPAFHWRELDAPDFTTFVTNLRKIGCPEPTIRDIIDGELRDIYAAQAPHGAAAPASVMAEHRQAAQRVNSAGREAQRQQVLASLLAAGNGGPHSSYQTPGVAPQSTTSAPPQAATGGGQPADREASATQQVTQAADQIPAAFQVGDNGSATTSSQEISTEVTDPALDAETTMHLTLMRHDFAQAISPDPTAPLDPGSREYKLAWLRAKQESNDRFSSMYGGEALNALHRQSMLKAGQTAVGK